MQVKSHIISSIPIGILTYIITNDYVSTILSMLVTIFMDLDHLYEYYVTSDMKSFHPLKILDEFPALKFKQILVFFHAYEYILILFVLIVISKNMIKNYFIGIFIGYSVHIILDTIFNKTYLFTYLLIYRFKVKFKAEKVFKNYK